MIHSTKQRPAFALIVSLVLMSFIVLLFFSLSALVNIEINSGTQAVQLRKARNNAMIGLQIAIEQLTQTAGPDQRITTTAELLDTSENGETAIPNPHWTGVWQNQGVVSEVPGKSTYDPQFVNWLVSGNHGDVIEYPANLDISSDSNASALLVGPGSTDSNSMVHAPIVSVLTGDVHTGSYAWWVGDEGVKAQINLLDPLPITPANTDAGKQKLTSPTRFGIELVTLDDTEQEPIGDRFPIGNESLKALLSINSLALVDPSEESTLNRFRRNRFHDITAFSERMMTDTKNGGWKHDLTWATRLSDSDWESFKTEALPEDDGLLFPSATGSEQLNDPGGPHWDQLKAFCQQADDINNSGPEASIAPSSQTQTHPGIAPILLRQQLIVGASLWSNSAQDTQGVRLHFLPMVVLWNPYDIAIEADNYYFSWGPHESWHEAWVSVTPRNGDPKSVPNSRFNPPKDGFANEPTHLLYASATDGFLRTDLTRIIPPPSNQDGGTETQTPVGRDTEDNQFNQTPLVPSRHRQKGGIDSADTDRGFHFLVESPSIPAGEALYFTPPSTGSNRNVMAPWPSWDNKLTAGFRYANYYYDLPPIADLPLSNNNIVIDKIFIRGAGLGGGGRVIMALDPYDRDTPPTELLKYIGDMGYFTANWRRGWPAEEMSVNASFSFDEARHLAIAYMLTLRMSDNLDGVLGYPPSDLFALPWLAHYNPRATVIGRSSFEIGRTPGGLAYRAVPNYSETLFRGSESQLTELLTPTNIHPPVGLSYFETASPQRSILFKTFHKDTELQSIGDLMHAPLYQSRPQEPMTLRTRNQLLDGLYPAHPIGNSLMPAYFTQGLTTPWRNDWDGSGRYANANNDFTHYDMSYLLNESLWNRFYFSTGANENESIAYQNPRIVSNTKTDLETLSHPTQSSPHIALNGAFNVNSTSRNAWRAFLGSFLKVTGYNYATNSTITPQKDQSIFTKVNYPRDAPYESGTLDETSAHSGHRIVDADDINQLADSIVTVIKERGPFLSMSHFINRELAATNPQHELMGALQQAINASGINDSITADVEATNSKIDIEPTDYPTNGLHDFSRYNLDALAIDRAFGTSGYMTQADILSRLGSTMTVRSDTFVVRSYGEIRNPITGDFEARTWCEATVQRTPEPLYSLNENPNDPDYWNTDPDAPSQARRFKIIQFRWLTQNEI